MGQLKQGTFVLLLVALLPALAFAGVESPRVAALRAATSQGLETALADFWRTIEKSGTPLVEPMEDGKRIRVTFVLRAPPAGEESGEGHNVGLIGSFLPGGSRELVRFERVAGTDVLQKSFVLDARSRYRYYFAWPQGREPDAQAVSRLLLEGLSYELFADPHAMWSFTDDFDGRPVRTSYFEGPAAPAEPWLAQRANVHRGNVETIDVTSHVLGNARKVSVYIPAGYQPRGSGYPFLLLFDREAYLQSVPTATILDNLISDGALPPLVAILVSPIDEEHRSEELQPNPRFESFIVEELLPRLRGRWRITRDPRKSVVVGSSLGGLASAHIARSHPEVFGNVLSMSGSYWWHPAEAEGEDDVSAEARSGWLPRQFASSARLPLRLYVCVGLGEGRGMLAPNRLFRDVLTAKGYPLRYEEFDGDHSYLNWRDSLVAGLRFLLAGA